MDSKLALIGIVIVLAIFIAGCVVVQSGNQPGNASVGIANPASVYCVDKGGTSEIRNGAGGQYGVCILKNGTVCEEWSYMRGECAPPQG